MAKKVIYYSDPLNDDFAGNHITTKPVGKDFPFLHKSFWWNIWSFFIYYFVAIPLVFIICKVYLGLKFENKKNMRKVGKSGCFLYGNHTRSLDAVLPAMAAFPKRGYIVANPDAVSIPGLRNLVQLIGCIPLPTELKAFPGFLEALETRCREGACVGIFPEAHIWPFYTGVRPFVGTSFRYPVRLDVPVVAMATTYRKRRGLFFWAKRPGMTVTFSEPMYPNHSLSPRAAQEDLRQRAYEFMCRVTGRGDNVEYIRYERQSPAASE
ncbi:MAG: 1-acyl-sn-glycerol-3-phosphate acyltransferase [Clostridiales bacterium]|nr:1-acyl-sn-glycerol-3-phosphate acyltransferase [Clostridiales bacterium]